MKSLAYLMLLALPALNAQQNPDGTVGRGVNFYSMEKEAALGAQLASEFQRQNRILDNAQVNGYIERVGGRLLKQITETGFTVHFTAFVDSEKSGIHEPWVLPGGYIYIPESLILTARDEAEFAGMLARAVAHAANRDATRQASRGELENSATIPLRLSTGGPAYVNRQGAGVMVPISFLQFLRPAEREADYRAVLMMAGAGWDPEALARYIEREQPDTGTQRAFSALPPRDERVAAIRKVIVNLMPRDYSTSTEFAAIQAEVRRLDADRAPRTAPPTFAPPQK